MQKALANATELRYHTIMTQSSRIFQALKAKGHKLTQVRRLIITLLITTKDPLAAADIQQSLEELGETVNKTTVYREILFLKEKGFIRQVQFEDEKIRYEAARGFHHHHLVCTNCDRVDDVDSVLMESTLKEMQSLFKNHKSFSNITHNLEFFGLCNSCA